MNSDRIVCAEVILKHHYPPPSLLVITAQAAVTPHEAREASLAEILSHGNSNRKYQVGSLPCSRHAWETLHPQMVIQVEANRSTPSLGASQSGLEVRSLSLTFNLHRVAT